jgi:hypothetical protein
MAEEETRMPQDIFFKKAFRVLVLLRLLLLPVLLVFKQDVKELKCRKVTKVLK